MLRKIVAWPVAWGLFWTGHIVSRCFLRFDALAWMYPAYNGLMIASSCVQDWAGLQGPWDALTEREAG